MQARIISLVRPVNYAAVVIIIIIIILFTSV